MKPGRASTTFVLAAAVAVGVVASGCGSSKVAAGGTFKYAIVGGDPGTISPFDLATSDSIEIAKNLYDGLVDYNPETAKIQPVVAASWDHNEDSTEWTFHLKRGLKFSNGEQLTAQSFIADWDVVANPKSRSTISYHFSTIDGFDEMQSAGGKIKHLRGVSAPDRYTLQVKLSRPDNVFDYRVGHPAFSPIPVNAFKRRGKQAFAEHPIGNGPFVVVSYKHNQQIVVKRNPHYRTGATPKLDRVIFKIYASDDAAYKDFQAHDLDETEVPIAKIVQAEKNPSWNYISHPILSLYFYGFKVDVEPWKSSIKLRQAINYAIDRQNIVDNVWNGAATVATGIVPPTIPGYESGAMPYRYDPARSKQLLKQAGYPNGRGLDKLVLGYNTGSGHEEVAAAIQADLKRVGIDMDAKGYAEFTTQFIPKLQAGDIDFFRLGWGADYPVQDNFIFPLFYGPNSGSDNLSYFKDAGIDASIVRAQAEPDVAKREAEYRSIEKRILDQAPIAPIFFYKTKRVTWDNVDGYVRSLFDDTPLELASFK